jgi:hypothetical protein
VVAGREETDFTEAGHEDVLLGALTETEAELAIGALETSETEFIKAKSAEEDLEVKIEGEAAPVSTVLT